MRRLATPRLRTIADAAGLIATGALLLGPAALGPAGAGLGGTMAAVVRAAAARAAVETAVRMRGAAAIRREGAFTGIRPLIAGIAIRATGRRATAGRATGRRATAGVAIVERGLLRVTRLEVAGGATAL